GYVFISTNYRLLPAADPLAQAGDVATALAAAQKKAAQWGGDPSRFILMGHSAGAHLVALIASSPTLGPVAGAQNWLGTISLDSAALNVPEIMTHRHFPLYDEAFTNDPAAWPPVSPYDVLVKGARPMMLICSSRRVESCANAHQFSARMQLLGGKSVLREE